MRSLVTFLTMAAIVVLDASCAVATSTPAYHVTFGPFLDIKDTSIQISNYGDAAQVAADGVQMTGLTVTLPPCGCECC
jgi:hypothetical protein